MKELHITDVHQGTAWRRHIKKYFDQVDKVIFHGDYFDNRIPGKKADADIQIKIFKGIMTLKHKYPNKVITLVGNHDESHFTVGWCRSSEEEAIQKTLLHYQENLDIAYQGDTYVSSHAGFSKTWISRYEKMFNKTFSIEELNQIYKRVDWLSGWQEKDKDSQNLIELLEFYRWAYDIYGDDKEQGPLWIRPRSLIEDAYYPKQIVGHSPYAGETPIMLHYYENELILLDSYFHDNCLLLIDGKPEKIQDLGKEYEPFNISGEINKLEYIANRSSYAKKEGKEFSLVEEMKENPSIYSKKFIEKVLKTFD